MSNANTHPLTHCPFASGDQGIMSMKPLAKGDRVRRGKDWKWDSQDGHPGNVGTVIDCSDKDGWVTVKWDGGSQNGYRWGVDGNYDLELAQGMSCCGCRRWL